MATTETSRRRARRSLSLALLGLAFATPAAGAERTPTGARAVVALRAESSVRGPEIRLGEVADITGEDAELVARLRSLEVGRAALPGLSRTVDLPYLQARVRHQPADGSGVILDGPSAIAVRTESQTVTGEALFAAVRDYLRAGQAAGAADVEIRPGASLTDLTLPVGRLDLRIRSGSSGELRGTVSPAVELWVEGVLARSISVPVRVSAMAAVLVAARPIPRHTLISEEDFRVERRELLAGQEPLRDTRLALGHRAVRAIQPGEPLQAAWLEQPPLVRRGEVVQLRVEGRGLRAAAPGEAREEGKAGQVIRVRNLASGREVYGQVDGEGRVRVPF